MSRSESRSMMPFRFSLRSRVKAEAHDVDGLVQLFFEAAETERRMPRAVDHRVKGCWPEASILLEPDERTLVWAAAHSAARRARGARWKAIAKQIGVHPTTAKRRFERAILGLWYRL